MINNRIIFLAVLAAVLLRLALGFTLRDSFFERGNRYHILNPLAENIIERHEFSVVPGRPTAANEPFFALFLAVSYAAMGRNWLAVSVLHSLLCVAHALVLYRLSRVLFDHAGKAYLAMLLFCFYPYYVTQSISVSDTSAFSFLLCLSALLTVWISDRPKLLAGLLTGLSWGLTLLTRFSAVSLFPFAFVYLFLRLPVKRAAAVSALLFFGCVLTLAPWVIRNHSYTGRFFVVSLRSAEAVWFAYNEDSRYVISHDISVDRMRDKFEERVPGLTRSMYGVESSDVTLEVKASDLFLADAIDYMRAHPVECAAMLPIKFIKFWSFILNPRPPSSDGLFIRLWPMVYTASYLPVLFFGLAGMLTERGSWKRHSILIFFFIGYSLMHTAVYGFSRLRLPLDQFLMIYASCAVFFLYSRVASRRPVPSRRRED